MSTTSRAQTNTSVSSRNRDNVKSEAQESEAEAGKSLLEGNGFKVIKKIGSGSYSKVKLAFSDNHQSMVAIKVVTKSHVPEEFLRKFLYNEIKVVKFLKHENIIKYYQSIESSHRLYVIMQFAENGSILDLIHKERRLPESQARELFRQVIAGIEYCHKQGIAHRDIKCENILLDENNTVKLIDFGFAKSFRETAKTMSRERLVRAISDSASKKPSSHRNTEEDPLMSETYCGSYAYASPEILKGIPYDPFKSDVWAMGCVLYAMVLGRLPFDDRDPSKLIKQVQAPVVFPTSIDVSDTCKACIRKILAPLKHRIDIASLKNDLWVANISTVPSRKLYTR